MAYDVAVRSSLVNKGIPNEDIGYEPQTGFVTVKGQSFMKPQKNFSGTTYTDQNSFNNAWEQYSRPQNQQVQYTASQTPNFDQVQSQYLNYKTPTNPYNDQISSLLNTIQQRVNTQINPNDIYNSPMYAAQQAQSQRQAQQGIRAAQESLGASGFGRSTALSENAQRIQNDANDYMNTQVLPAIYNQLQSQRQTDLSNLNNFLGSLQQQQQYTANQSQLERDNLLASLKFLSGEKQNKEANAIALGNALGSYLTPEQRDAINQMKSNSAAWFNASPEEQQVLAAKNQDLGSSIGATQDEQGNWVFPQGTPTVAQRQFDYGIQKDKREFDYKQARDAIEDERYKNKFDEDVRRYDLDYALKKAIEEGQLSVSRMNAATSAQNAKNSAYNADFGRLMDVWKATGKAPAGLESYGVQAGADFADSKQIAKLDKEMQGLYAGLSSGHIDSAKAIDEIKTQLAAGMYTPTEAANLMNLVQQFANNQPQKPISPLSPAQTKQIEDSGGINYQNLSPQELEKAWSTDPTGKAAGTPIFDWATWVRDPRGRMSGTSFNAYQQAYGPRLGR